jgi:predicted nucleotidyltransferase
MNGNPSTNNSTTKGPKDQRRIMAALLEAAIASSDRLGNFNSHDANLVKVITRAYRSDQEITRERILQRYLVLLMNINSIEYAQGTAPGTGSPIMQFNKEFPELVSMDIALIAQFVSEIRHAPGLEAVFLYGSASRGELGKGSDIDLLLVFKKTPLLSINSTIAKIVTWLNPEREIQCTATDLTDIGPKFLENVSREGFRLYGGVPLNKLIGCKLLPLQSNVIISYALGGLPYSKKVRVSRKVHGYTTKKTIGGKQHVYHYAGLKDSPGSMLISEGTLLLPEGAAQEFSGFLSEQGVPHKKKHVEIIFTA